MDEYVVQQKIQKALMEPHAPEALIQKVILRAKAVTMGVDAQKQLETAPAEQQGYLVSRVLIGQLAAVSELPEGAQPEQLAQQLEQAPAFAAAMRGGNIARRLQSGELLQQIVGTAPTVEMSSPQKAAPQKEGPVMG